MSKHQFNKGDTVWVKSGTTHQMGVIIDKNLIYGEWIYTIQENGRTRKCKSKYIDAMHQQESPYELLSNDRIGNYFTFLCLITLDRLNIKSSLSNNYYSVNATKTQFYPHQLKPLIKFLDSEKGRLLICDEVGLGKTIEAGIILKELSARLSNELKSVIIVCPSNLREKWQDELFYKFDFEFDIVKKSNDLIHLLDRSKTKTKKFIITSYEIIRSDTFTNFIEDNQEVINFDLAIFDEAHWMKNEQSKQHKIGKLITSISHRIIFLTATPVQMIENDLFNLLKLLDEYEYTDKRTFDLILNINKPLVKAQRIMNKLDFSKTDLLKQIQLFRKISDFHSYKYDTNLVNNIIQIIQKENIEYGGMMKIQEYLSKLNLLSSIYNRTRKIDVTENKVIRDAKKEACYFDKNEKKYYERITDIVCETVKSFNENGKKVPISWIANNYQRQITSSILSFISKRKTNEIFSEDNYDIEVCDFEGVALSNALKSKINNDKELIKLESIIYNSKTDSKLQKLSYILDEIMLVNQTPKIMLFSFFKASLKTIQAILDQSKFEVFRIDGSIAKKDRSEVVNDFRTCSSPSILLSSKIGTEGLDFQFCDILINYDLPWNPMELEQRIGRLDRIGQESEKIHIYNLYYDNSIEDRILMRLYDRIGIFNNSIGDLEDIIGNDKQLLIDIYNPMLSQKEKEDRLIRNEKAIIEQRRLISEIESKADEFLGLDQFFTNKIRKIKDNKQYITAQHINSIYEDFFLSKFPSAKYHYDLKNNIGSCILEAEFKRDFRKYLLESAEELGEIEDIVDEILKKVAIEFTYDGKVASENPRLEFFNVFHPITKYIIDYYNQKRTRNELVKTYNIMLISDEIPEDYYMIFTTIIKGKAFVAKNYYTTIILNSKGEELSTEDYGMDFLSMLLENAKDSNFNHPFTEIDFKVLKTKYEEIILRTFNNFEKDFVSEANRTYEKKILSINKTYQLKIDSLQSTIYSHEESIRNQPDIAEKLNPIIKMNKGYIENLQYSKEKQINQINNILNKLICDYDEVSTVGILKVINTKNIFQHNIHLGGNLNAK